MFILVFLSSCLLVFLKGYHAATVAQVLVLIVDDSKLARSDALNVLVTLDEPLRAIDLSESALGKMRSVTILESYLV